MTVQNFFIKHHGKNENLSKLTKIKRENNFQTWYVWFKDVNGIKIYLLCYFFFYTYVHTCTHYI